MTIQIRNLSLAAAAHPEAEERRLAELGALNMLDTAAARRFDRYAELVATFLDVPVALVSFADDDRQWFNSACEPDVAALPREISFCAHALTENELLVVPDAQLDARFLDNPLVRDGPRIRFFAGAVIRGPTGHALGTCSAFDFQARDLSDRERKALILVARMIEREMLTSASAEDSGIRWHRGTRHDITGLPDMALFRAGLAHDVDLARNREHGLLLAIVRLDQFDALEAAIGRQAALYIVGQLARSLESTAPQGSSIGQAREDELCLSIPLGKGVRPETILDAMLQTVPTSFSLGEHTVSNRVSVGACVYPLHADSAEKLIKRARTALWSKPVSARSGYNVYRRHQSDHATRYFKMQSAMERAMDRQEFRIVYQPKIDIHRRQLAGAEALLRWESDEMGNVSPSEFIPIAEQTGLIVDLGNWVLRKSARQLNRWKDAGLDCPEMAINISSLQLRQSEFLKTMESILAGHRLERGKINLELTESSLVEDIDGAVKLMLELNGLGISFSIDDFGTGFSSLNYLRKMPVNVLKIDRSFVSNIVENKGDRKLVRSIVSIGHDLDMLVVAEGVESENQLSFLRTIGCDQIQGYVFGRPMTPAQFLAFANSGWNRPGIVRAGSRFRCRGD